MTSETVFTSNIQKIMRPLSPCIPMPAKGYSDKEFILSLKEKDSATFKYLYNQYSPALYGIVFKILADRELTNDVLQEVFVSIYKKIDSYDTSKGTLFTWMLNIARNESIDTLRSKAYKRSQKTKCITDFNGLDGMGKVVSINVDLVGLKRAVYKLKPEFHTLIELFYFKGYTHAVIADMTDLPLGTVKTRIRNALIELRGLFDVCPDAEGLIA